MSQVACNTLLHRLSIACKLQNFVALALLVSLHSTKNVFLRAGESRDNFCRWLPSKVFVEDVFLFEVSRQKQCQTNAYG